MSADNTVPAQRSPAGWMLYMLAACVACGIAGILLDQRLDSHLLPYRWGPDKDTPITELRGEKRQEAVAQLRTTGIQGGAAALGIVAGALAFALCLVDAIKLRRPVSFLLTPFGAALGGAAGFGAGNLAMRLHERFELGSGASPTLTEAIMLQTAAWICAGLGVSLGVWVSSVGRRSLVDTLLGGVLAGAFVGALYPPLASVFFPNENTDRLFPETGMFPAGASGPTGVFLFWVLFTSVLFSVILGGVGSRTPKAVAESSPSVDPVPT